MKTGNVCKFSPTRSSDLICVNFIKESENEQASGVTAKHHALHLVASGEGTLEKSGAEIALARGTLFFVREGERFAVRGDGALVYYYISFFGRRAEELIARFGLEVAGGVFSDCEGLLPFWEECQGTAEAGNIDILCESVLLYSLARLRPVRSEVESAVSKVVAIMQDRFTEHNLTLPAIAKEIGYDPKYLSSLFKKKKGVSFTQLLRELRLRHAVFLMEQGVASVKNIALLSGFADALYFSKVFSLSMGTSPKAYIAALQEAQAP